MKRLIVVLVVALALLGCEEKLKGSFAISSVSFGEETGGSFFLGSGSVKERIVYYGFIVFILTGLDDLLTILILSV